MTGSKMISMTLEEMRAARERGASQSDWKRVHLMVQVGIEPAEDDASWQQFGSLAQCGHSRHPSRLHYDWEFSVFDTRDYMRKLG